MSTLILIPILTAFAILALVAAVYNLRYRNATINDRLQRMVNADEALVTGEAAKLDDSIFDSTVPAWLQPLAALGPGHRRDSRRSRCAHRRTDGPDGRRPCTPLRG